MTTIDVLTAAYLGVTHPRRIKPHLSILLSNRSCLPRVDDLRSDWVAHVAAPAFSVYRRRKGGGRIDSFCSIGTGSGLDALVAIELLGAERVGLTDLHEDVVATAAGNVASNHLPSHPVTIESGHGDLLAPLRRFDNRYALFYENLPNVPLSDGAGIANGRKSSSHVPPRVEKLPELVKRQMLDLHYLALVQAKEFLLPGDAVLSTLGARVPLEVLLSLGRLTGYSPSFLIYRPGTKRGLCRDRRPECPDYERSRLPRPDSARPPDAVSCAQPSGDRDLLRRGRHGRMDG